MDFAATKIKVGSSDVSTTNPVPVCPPLSGSLPVKLVDTNNTAQGVLMESGSLTERNYLQAISEGDIAGHSPYSKMAYSPAQTTTEGDIWGLNTSYVFPTTAIQMAVVSTSANDTSAGTGARTVRIWYLKSDYSEATTDVILNGTTPVNTSVSDIFRVNNFRILTTGTGYKAAGNISLTSVGGATSYSVILTGFTRARNSIYTVPLGKTYYITSINVGCTKTSSSGVVALITLRATYDNLTGTALTPGLFFMPYAEFNIQDGSFVRQFEEPMKFIAGTDIKFSCTAGQSATVVTSVMRGWLE